MKRRPSIASLKAALEMRVDGVLFWTVPPKGHPDLRGQIAGTPTPNHCGKVYWIIQFAGRKYRRSQLIYVMTRRRWARGHVDHRDGNSQNDAPLNLRDATPTQNAWNHKTRKRSKRADLPMGVHPARTAGRYEARIAVNKKKIYLGTYPTPAAAASAYQAARVTHFGEYA